MGKQKYASRDKNKNTGNQSRAESVDASLRVRAGAVFALLGLARFLAAFFPDARLWGLNHAAYLPQWTGWALLGISLALCTPAFLAMFHAAGRLLFGSTPDTRSRSRFLAASVLALSLIHI